MRKFEIGDRVTVRETTSMFHTRTQAFIRGHTGVIVEYRPEWVIPEDEAYYGGGQVIMLDPESGALLAGAEPRNDGAAVAY